MAIGVEMLRLVYRLNRLRSVIVLILRITRVDSRPVADALRHLMGRKTLNAVHSRSRLALAQIGRLRYDRGSILPNIPKSTARQIPE